MITDSRYIVSSVEKIKSISADGISEFIEVLSIEHNKEHNTQVFKDTVNDKKLEKSSLINCQLLELTNDIAIFNVYGLSGFLEKKHCSWKRSASCEDVFKKGSEYPLRILFIDNNNERIILTNRKENENPLLLSNCPKVREIVKVEINVERNKVLLGITKDDFEIVIPKEELSWSQFEDYSKYLNKSVDVIVYDITIDDDLILGSIKRNISNPWQNINTIYPRDSLIVAEVEHVNEFGVCLMLPNGLLGFLRKDRIITSKTPGDFVKGTMLEVVIDKVIGETKKIYLRLPK